ncbi:MAG: NAD-dependent epimerase/dehydratase family protein [Melioribacteraceae bacterium]|nr:MAG: NAD-dependent epimerase/dehydratase family protein [Melioribacteraceae bacterium]
MRPLFLRISIKRNEMKILLIGGTGFISSNVVELLLNEEHDITILNRGKSKIHSALNNRIKFIKADRHDKNKLLETASYNFDVVYDFVAYTEEESALMADVFYGKTKRFVHTSTVSVYMVSKEFQCPITEDQDKGKIMEFWGRNPFGMQYGIDKRKCENVLWNAHDKNNFPVTIIRPPYVCGPGDPAIRDYFWIQRILDGNPILIPGSGDYASQHVFVKDLAKAFVDIIKTEKTIGQAYNVAAEEIFSLNDYLDNLCKLLKKNPERINIDLEVFENLPYSIINGGHAFPFNTYSTAIFSIKKIVSDINFKPTPFNEWMPLTIDWYLNKFKGDSVGYNFRKDEVEFINKWKMKFSQFKNGIIS